LLKSRRQLLHKHIAETLEQRFPEIVNDEPEVVAHHYTEAGLYKQATDYWLKGAQRNVQRFDNAEAIGHATRGLQLIEHLPEGIDRDMQELFLQVNLGTALGTSKGYTPPEVGEAFERARELSERVGDNPANVIILVGLWTYYLMRADYATSAKVSSQLMALGERLGDLDAIVWGHQCTAGTAMFRGDLELALQHAKAGCDVYERTSTPFGPTYGYDPGTLCFEWVAWISLIMGKMEYAKRTYANGIDFALKHAHPLTVATTRVHMACFDALREDPEAALVNGAEATAFCSDNSILLRGAEAQIVEGWAIAEIRDADQGVRQVEAALDLWQQLGAHVYDSAWYLLLAKAYSCAGRFPDARNALASAFRAAKGNSEHFLLAELHRFDGELHLASTESADKAAECFQKALDDARGRRAGLLELRAAASLSKLWQSQGKKKEAHDLLAPVYNWFTEGFDTKDLKDAKALLDELSA
jgi:predicted ATPase